MVSPNFCRVNSSNTSMVPALFAWYVGVSWSISDAFVQGYVEQCLGTTGRGWTTSHGKGTSRNSSDKKSCLIHWIGKLCNPAFGLELKTCRSPRLADVFMYRIYLHNLCTLFRNLSRALKRSVPITLRFRDHIWNNAYSHNARGT